jgi:hypothetical protein
LIDAIFDDNPETLYKSTSINPVEFDLIYPHEHEFHSLFIIHGAAPVEVLVTFFSADGQTIKSYTAKFDQHGDVGNTLNFDEAVKSSKVSISVKIPTMDASGIVHLWGITLK